MKLVHSGRPRFCGPRRLLCILSARVACSWDRLILLVAVELVQVELLSLLCTPLHPQTPAAAAAGPEVLLPQTDKGAAQVWPADEGHPVDRSMVATQASAGTPHRCSVLDALLLGFGFCHPISKCPYLPFISGSECQLWLRH